MTSAILPVVEIFGPTIQGEGPVIGQPTVFVRLGGCDYRCAWCDSLHAVMPQHRNTWKRRTAAEIIEHVRTLSPRPIMVTLSGGNPAMHNLAPLIELGHEEGYTFCLETQGSIAKLWFRDVDVVVLSPKPPSSGMTVDWDRFGACLDAAGAELSARVRAIKVPIFTLEDLDWFEDEVAARHANRYPLFVSIGNSHAPPDAAATLPMQPWRTPAPSRERLVTDLLQAYRQVAGEILRRGIPATVLPQLHVLTWGNERGR